MLHTRYPRAFLLLAVIAGTLILNGCVVIYHGSYIIFGLPEECIDATVRIYVRDPDLADENEYHLWTTATVRANLKHKITGQYGPPNKPAFIEEVAGYFKLREGGYLANLISFGDRTFDEEVYMRLHFKSIPNNADCLIAEGAIFEAYLTFRGIKHAYSSYYSGVTAVSNSFSLFKQIRP